MAVGLNKAGIDFPARGVVDLGVRRVDARRDFHDLPLVHQDIADDRLGIDGCVNESAPNEKHIAFHVSGGTTEALLVNGADGFVTTDIVAKTLDLNAGQLIDRIGVMLGLHFPCGAELERLALSCEEKIKVRPTLKGMDCCLSGGQNIAEKYLKEGRSPAYLARFAMEYAASAIVGMSERIRETYGDLPFVYAGGVMSDSIIREELCSRFDCLFAKPEFSCDNAAGTAVLAYIKDNES